jgi:pyruvate dehydrogenase E1 component alpha subunit
MSEPATDKAAAKLHLNRAHGLRLLREMLRIRRFEERCAELYTEEKIRGFLHLYIGEEAVAVGVMQCLTPEDAVVATYREHGHALARGLPMTTLMAEMYGKRSGVSRGRGGSMHLFDAASRFYGGSAIVGAGLPLAVGLALADRLQQRERITCCFFGEGAVAIERSESETDIGRTAESYRVPAVSVDGMDVIAVEATARAAAAEVRAGAGPRLLECRTYRFRAHSMFDAQLYRDKAEVEAWKQKGPLLRFGRWLEEAGLLDADEHGCIEAEIAEEVDAAVAFAEAADWEPVADLLRDVYTDDR